MSQTSFFPYHDYINRILLRSFQMIHNTFSVYSRSPVSFCCLKVIWFKSFFRILKYCHVKSIGIATIYSLMHNYTSIPVIKLNLHIINRFGFILYYVKLNLNWKASSILKYWKCWTKHEVIIITLTSLKIYNIREIWRKTQEK